MSQRKQGVVVWVTTSFVGFHCWPDAPDDVAYLRNRHRHVFNVKVTCPVTHADRDIEFHQLKRTVNLIVHDIQETDLETNPAMSCEMIADAIFLRLRRRLIRVHQIAVDEDGECGAIAYYDYSE